MVKIQIPTVMMDKMSFKNLNFMKLIQIPKIIFKIMR
jgi:hypothetical protein